MPNKSEDAKRYALKYPSYLDANRKMWTADIGDRYVKDGVVYKVVQIVSPLIKGDMPRIVLNKEEDANPNILPF
jgi:hypothetical protein